MAGDPHDLPGKYNCFVPDDSQRTCRSEIRNSVSGTGAVVVRNGGQLTDVDQEDHVALCASVESPDLKTERGVGIARFIRVAGAPATAEAAITVVDDMHRKGVGTALLHELVRAARLRGVVRFRAEVLEENATMRTILERAGARPAKGDSGGGTIAYDLSLD